MELAGEEKKLQALFSELKTADEQVAPRFATVWNRAQLQPRRIGAFTAALVAATALIAFGLVSLAVWLKYSKPAQAPTIQATVATPAKIESAPVIATATTSPSPKVAVPAKQEKVNRELTAKRIVPRRDAQLARNRKLSQEAKTISDWQSPTTALMSSPNSEIFSSLPQFNQSTTDLKSFLPSRSN
jgi:hypothetical protein